MSTEDDAHAEVRRASALYGFLVHLARLLPTPVLLPAPDGPPGLRAEAVARAYECSEELRAAVGPDGEIVDHLQIAMAAWLGAADLLSAEERRSSSYRTDSAALLLDLCDEALAVLEEVFRDRVARW